MLGILLALLASVAHAAWNTVVQRVSGDGLPALWAYSLVSAVLVTLGWLVLVAVGGGTVWTWPMAGIAAVSMTLHTGYGMLIQEAYRRFDLTQVYPLSRGLAPVLVAGSAYVVVGQSLRPAQGVGLALMVVAVAAVVTERTPGGRRANAAAFGWGVGIAVAIAAYTTWDGWAIVEAGVDPLAYSVVSVVLQSLLLTAILGRRVPAGGQQLARHPGSMVVLGALIPGSYLLALYATQLAPVAVVAAIRSSSLVWAGAVAMLTRRERVSPARVTATVCATAAIVAMVW